MRLLNTRTGEFKWVDNTEDITYAILSHTWSPHGEQSYSDLLAIQTQVRLERDRALQSGSPVPPRDEVLRRASPKIRGACAYALAEGFEYIWIDSGCIDKTNSVELSEAINSMFRWYSHAAVCYVFLEDVSGDDNPAGLQSCFRRSRWFTRGWTLQELIAPRAVVFCSAEWEMIGGKDGLAGVIEEVTGIQAGILVHSTPLHSASVACRMSWASRRVTTRKEDEAYSLMGIFGVNMPTIYGEGRLAFVRLQEEILKNIPDQSIFVWQRSVEDTDSPDEEEERSCTLFATCPADFARSGHIRAIKKSTLCSQFIPARATPPHPNYLVTAYGIRMTLPVLAIRSDLRLAILSCVDERRVVALVLRWNPDTDVYVVGHRLEEHIGTLWYRSTRPGGLSPSDPTQCSPFWHPLGTVTSAAEPEESRGYLRVVCLEPQEVWMVLKIGKAPCHEFQRGNLLAKVSYTKLCIPHRPLTASLRPGRMLPRKSSIQDMHPYKVYVPSWCHAHLASLGYSLMLKFGPPSHPAQVRPAYTFELSGFNKSAGIPKILINIRSTDCPCHSTNPANDRWSFVARVNTKLYGHWHSLVIDTRPPSGMETRRPDIPWESPVCREPKDHVQGWRRITDVPGTTSNVSRGPGRWQQFLLPSATDTPPPAPETPADVLVPTSIRLTFVRDFAGNGAYPSVFSLSVEVLSLPMGALSGPISQSSAARPISWLSIDRELWPGGSESLESSVVDARDDAPSTVEPRAVSGLRRVGSGTVKLAKLAMRGFR